MENLFDYVIKPILSIWPFAAIIGYFYVINRLYWYWRKSTFRRLAAKFNLTETEDLSGKGTKILSVTGSLNGHNVLVAENYDNRTSGFTKIAIDEKSIGDIGISLGDYILNLIFMRRGVVVGFDTLVRALQKGCNV